MLIALLYANLFLAPMLLLFGPASAARTGEAAEARDEPSAGDRARGTELMPSPAPSPAHVNGKGGEPGHATV